MYIISLYSKIVHGRVKLMTNLKNQIKLLLIHKGISMTELVNLLNERYERNDVVQNLNNKLTKETLKYAEILEITEVLDYNIAFIPKTEKLETGKNGIYFAAQLPSVEQKVAMRREMIRMLNENLDSSDKPSDE